MKSHNTTERIKRYSIIIGIMITLLVVFVYGSKKIKINNNDVEIVPEIKVEDKIEPVEQIASWYDYSLQHKDQRCTKDREPCYSQRTDTCASRDYPRGSILKVSKYPNTITCRVNDYGPEESTGRSIDLSSHAFEKLAPLKLGLINVTIEKVN